jgi:dTMP kinase
MSDASDRRGRFVVLDGIDGCGKSTQAERLAAALESWTGRAPLHLREPGSTAAGERIRELLLSTELEIVPGCEALLFAAARRQTLEELVAPALADGRDVVCERFHASTYAYQAAGGGLDPDAVRDLLRAWADEPAPDLTVILDLDLDEALRRRGPAGDRIEAKGREFLARVADGYRAWSRLDERAVVVSASGSADEVAARVLAEVTRGA